MTKSEALDKELHDQYAREDGNNTICLHDRGARSKRQPLDNSRKEERDPLWNEIIEDDSHFSYPRIHLLMHFHNHILLFGHLPMYSTKIGESSHRTRIKKGYSHSNRNDYVNQILGYYGRHQGMHMRQENLRALLQDEKAYDDEVRPMLVPPVRETLPKAPLRLLRARQSGMQVVSDIQERYSRLTRDIDLCKLLTSYSRLSLSVEQRLAEDTEQLLSLPAELFNQVEVLVPSFDNPCELDIHHIRCAVSFRQQDRRHEWAWIKAGDESQFGAL